MVTTGLLYLGTYTITEITAPEGYILDDPPHDVTLAYGGQDVALVTESQMCIRDSLYLGTYTVTEKTAPDGYVQDTTVYDVTLFYGEQTVELVTEGISIDNAPQMGTITIEKRDKETGKPILLSDAVFRLHAKEDIVCLLYTSRCV